MDIENFLILRNLINSKEGKLLLDYVQDYVTENACKNREGLEIKGMCELVQHLKDIPKDFEIKRQKQN